MTPQPQQPDPGQGEREPDEMPQWIDMDELDYRRGCKMIRRRPAQEGDAVEERRYWLWERTDWPDRDGHFISDPQIVEDHEGDPDQRFTEYVPLWLLTQALDEIEQLRKGERHPEHLYRLARKIRSQLQTDS